MSDYIFIVKSVDEKYCDWSGIKFITSGFVSSQDWKNDKLINNGFVGNIWGLNSHKYIIHDNLILFQSEISTNMIILKDGIKFKEGYIVCNGSQENLSEFMNERWHLYNPEKAKNKIHLIKNNNNNIFEHDLSNSFLY